MNQNLGGDSTSISGSHGLTHGRSTNANATPPTAMKACDIQTAVWKRASVRRRVNHTFGVARVREGGPSGSGFDPAAPARSYRVATGGVSARKDGRPHGSYRCKPGTSSVPVPALHFPFARECISRRASSYMRPWPVQDFALSGGGFETGLIDTSVYSSVRGNADTDTVRTPLLFSLRHCATKPLK